MHYALPLFVLIDVPAFFFGLASGHYTQFGRAQILMRIFVALPLLFSGTILHFARMENTIAIVPPGFPDPAFLVALTGVLEVLGAIGLFVTAWRRRAGFLLTILMIAVFPANIYVAGSLVGGLRMPGVPARTAMQAAYILLILLASFGIPERSRRG